MFYDHLSRKARPISKYKNPTGFETIPNDRLHSKNLYFNTKEVLFGECYI